MSRFVYSPRSRLVTEAAGVRVVMTESSVPNENNGTITEGESSRRSIILKIDDPEENPSGKRSCGFHLSRSKWDPYPWVGYVEAGSIADQAGLRPGDCLLRIDRTDLVGLRVKDIASLVQKDCPRTVRLEVWRSVREDDREESEADEGAALAGPLPEVARKLVKSLSGTVRALECPVCMESATSPVSQCVHGHILCVGCRAKTPRCPICRVRLGQGRCLLADEIQRNIREAFQEPGDESCHVTASLRDKLFGKADKKLTHQSINRSNRLDGSSRVSSTKVKSSLARLLLGGFDKAASAENLSIPTLVEESTTMDGRPAAYRRLGELCLVDRTKSASTGELSRDNETTVNSSIYLDTNRAYTTSTGMLSVPHTPTWGGSTESINTSMSFACPLSRWTSCKEFVSANFVLEHLGRSHDAPQIYFHGPTATIPLPLPFGRSSSYVLRHRGELFFFQYEEEAIWLAGSGMDNLGEWTMLGRNDDGTEVKVRRHVARLDDTSAPLSSHLAPLPKALGINTVVVELLEARLGEGLEV